MSPRAFDDFEAIELQAEDARIFLRRSGSGPPVLLLHGFPQTHLMWRDVTPLLAQRFTVVAADLRGYGRSSCPASRPDHAPYAKRAMANDMVSVMAQLGHARFSVAGHDRGGRVAYRLALDHPQRVGRVAVLDVLTIADVWARPTRGWRRATGRGRCWRSLRCCRNGSCLPRPDAVVDNAIGSWGSPAHAFSAEVCAAYIEALRDPERVHLRGVSRRGDARSRARRGGSQRQTAHRLSGACAVEWTRASEFLVRGGGGSAGAVASPGPTMFVAARSTAVISFRRKFRKLRRRT